MQDTDDAAGSFAGQPDGGDSLLDAVVVRTVGSRAPDGRPLYGYGLDDDERSEFAAFVSSELKQWDRLRHSSVRLQRVSAAFCLYGSGCIRDRYAGGAWSWDLVLDTLPGGRLEQSVLRKLVELGLPWWRRGERLSQFGGIVQYLMSLAAEGGLPPGVLDVPGNPIRAYLLELLDDPSLTPASLRARAERLQERLAKSLRVAAVFDVAVDLVLRIRSGQLIMAGESPRVQRLLKDLDAERRERVRRAAAADAVPVRCAVSLVGEGGAGSESHRVVRELAVARIEDELDAGPALSQLFGVDEVERHRARFRIVAIVGERERQLAQVTRADGRYSMEPLAGPREIPAGAPVRLALRSREGDGASVPTPGGEPLPASLPWVFATSARCLLLSTGSVMAAGDAVDVVLPADLSGADLTLMGASQFDVTGSLRGGRIVGRLRGSATLPTPDGLISIATGPANGRGGLFAFGGATLDLGGGESYWRGRPDVYQFHDGSRRRLPPEQVQWRPVGGPGGQPHGWAPWHDGLAGELRCRVTGEEGAVLFADRCIVLPARTAVRVIGRGPHSGALRFDGLGASSVAAGAMPSGTTGEVKLVPGGGIELHCRGDGVGRVVELEVSWPEGRARLTAGNPVDVLGFRDGAQMLPPGMVVGLGDVERLVAEAAAAPPAEIRISDFSGSVAHLPASAGGSARLPLYSIAPLIEASLAASDAGAAARTELRVVGTHATTLSVKWSKCLLRVEDEAPAPGAAPAVAAESTITAEPVAGSAAAEHGIAPAVGPCDAPPESTPAEGPDGRETPAEAGDAPNAKPHEAALLSLTGGPAEGVRVELRPLAEPDATPVLAEPHRWVDDAGEGRSGWRFAFAGRPGGAWLATAWRDDALVAPARFVDVPAEPGPGSAAPAAEGGGATASDGAARHLRALINIPDGTDRMTAWAFELDAMALDPCHPTWPPVLAMANAAGRIPPESFDALRAAAAEPAALPMLLLLSAEPAVVLDRFDRLPLLWHAVPAAAWRQAMRTWGLDQRYRLMTAGLGLERSNGLVRGRLTRVIDAAVSHGAMSATVAWAARDLGQLGKEATPPTAWRSLTSEMARIWIAQAWAARSDETTATLPAHQVLRLPAGSPALRLLPAGAAGDGRAHPPLYAAAVAAGLIDLGPRDQGRLRLARALNERWFDAACALATAAFLHEHPPTV